jgi:hypothetical protein
MKRAGLESVALAQEPVEKVNLGPCTFQATIAVLE